MSRTLADRLSSLGSSGYLKVGTEDRDGERSASPAEPGRPARDPRHEPLTGRETDRQGTSK